MFSSEVKCGRKTNLELLQLFVFYYSLLHFNDENISKVANKWCNFMDIIPKCESKIKPMANIVTIFKILWY